MLRTPQSTLVSGLLLACLAGAAATHAQQSPSQAVPTAVPAANQVAPANTGDAQLPLPLDAVPRALQAFTASYQVFHNGRTLGTATMQAAALEAPRWRIDLALRGSGLMRLTGLNLQQSTLFEDRNGSYRPLTQTLVKRVFLFNRKTVGTYDWVAGNAHWSGDVKKTRRQPVPLRPGDMSGLLINLAVVRDATPGATLRYRFVDDGRVRDHVYRTAPQTEVVQAGDLSYDAIRVERVQAGGEQTAIWVAAGVPTPIRILQREQGQDGIDLRLIEYH